MLVIVLKVKPPTSKVCASSGSKYFDKFSVIFQIRRPSDKYLKTVLSESIVYLIKRSNFKLYKVYPVVVIWKNR